ncbi:hypothetical protein [Ekhidna sp.]|uniref:hypothetical protein n=1 Tax=Ekhidna sp. TaxID=2608089 RepID=UPI0032EE445C
MNLVKYVVQTPTGFGLNGALNVNNLNKGCLMAPFSNFMRYIFSTIILFLSIGISTAQKRIVIVDSLTKIPVPYASIEVGAEKLTSGVTGVIELNHTSGKIEVISDGFNKIVGRLESIGDSIFLPPNVTYLEEVVVNSKLKRKHFKTGYLKGRDIQFKLKDQYEIGCFIPNTINRHSLFIESIQVDLVNGNNEGSFELRIYNVENGLPDSMTYAISNLSKKDMKNVSIADKISFSQSGVFISIKFSSNETSNTPFILLTDEYYRSKSFIRGNVYGFEWVELDRLNFRNVAELNTCISLTLTNH